MAPVDLPYVQLCRARGRVYGYYRRAGIRKRIPGAPGSPEFLTAYQAIHDAASANGVIPPDAPRTLPGSFRALWLAYRESAEWRAIKPITQEGYTRLIEPLLPRWGDLMVADMPPAWIMKRLDEMTPAKANHFLSVIRLLLNWSVPRGWVKISPATGIKRVKHKPASHRVWTKAEIAAMTGPEAGAVAAPVILALHTGQRLGDVLRLPWSAWDGKSITVAAQGKTGARVVIPALPELKAALNKLPRRAVVICTRKDGHAWKEDHFKHSFAAARAKLGLPADLHFHGLRHSAGKRLAEAGCSPQEIASILGHKTLGMVALYTAQVEQESLAKSAITKLKEHNRKGSVKQRRDKV